MSYRRSYRSAGPGLRDTTQSTAPTVNDDITLGYQVGDRWYDTTADKEYVCLDNTDGAAVWPETTSQGVTDHGSLSGLTDDDHVRYMDKDGSKDFTAGFFQLDDGQAEGVSDANKAKLKYDDASGDIEVSLSGGAYTPVQTGTESDTVYQGAYGDESDGAIVRSGSGTESGMIFCSSYTVNTGVNRRAGGYIIFCSGAFTLNGTGTYHNDGNAGVNDTAGAAIANQHLGGSGAGGAGGVGGAGSSAGAVTNSMGGNGGNGGTGMSSGTGGAATPPTGRFIQPRAAPYSYCGSIFDGTSANITRWLGAPGGGGGGGSGAGTGGGGGSGGAPVCFVADSLVGGNNVSSDGGDGADSDGFIDDAAGGGGGGGGCVVSTTGSTSGTPTVAGGSGGTGHGTGGNGFGGVAGEWINVPLK